MLLELAVTDLGVISELSLVLGPGMTALTGETGAGKTLVVEAIELLVGGRADSMLVRPGATEARVEGRFVVDGDELVLARVVPAGGRSRAYVDGRLAPVAALAEHGAALVDIHGQHEHQSLLRGPAQRDALDRYAGVDLGPLTAARRAVAEIDDALAGLGGDERARARELDLLRFQLDEIAAAAVTDPGEEQGLELEEDALAGASGHREAAGLVTELLVADGGAADLVGRAAAALTGRAPFGELEDRLRAALAEVTEAASDLRSVGEGIDDDPARLDAVRERRRLLRDLRRKYGDTLVDVLAFAEEAGARLAELGSHEARAAELEERRAGALNAVAREAGRVAEARRKGAPVLARRVAAHLAELAMEGARVEIEAAGAPPADDVEIRLGANPGEVPLPLAKAASGGELARAMLALRLVLTAGPPTLVFDEVDAGIGGAAALAVGRALAALGESHQVLVVTHLPQVAAFADAQVAVSKEEVAGRTLARAAPLDAPARVVELSRMLSGQPESEAARGHAEELLATAARSRSLAGGGRATPPAPRR